MRTIVLTPQTDWNVNAASLSFQRDRYRIEAELQRMKMSKDRSLFIETNLEEPDLREWTELAQDHDLVIYINTQAENLADRKELSIPAHVMMIHGPMDMTHRIRLNFINPPGWYITRVSQIGEHTDIYSCLYNMEIMNVTRLFILVDEPVPFDLRMHKIRYPGAKVQIIYKPLNHFLEQQKLCT